MLKPNGTCYKTRYAFTVPIIQWQPYLEPCSVLVKKQIKNIQYLIKIL